MQLQYKTYGLRDSHEKPSNLWMCHSNRSTFLNLFFK